MFPFCHGTFFGLIGGLVEGFLLPRSGSFRYNSNSSPVKEARYGNVADRREKSIWQWRSIGIW